MPRKISDAITETRIVLQDTVVPYRYSDSDLIRYLNNSLAEMRRIRPDLFVGRFTMQLPVYDETETDEPFPVGDMYFPATVNYMVAMSEMRNDQSTVDNRASIFMQIFASQMGVQV